MDAQKVVMVLAESCHNDSRVMREAKKLAEAGYAVVILALHKKGLSRIEERDGYVIIRLCCWLPDGSIVAMVVREAFFYFFSFLGILWIRPVVCHIHNPRALIPGVCAAKLVRAKIIYDSHEWWETALHRTDFPRWIFVLVVDMENYFAHKADVILTVSGSIARILRRRFHRPVFLIRNVSEIYTGPKNNLLREVLGLVDDERKIILYQGLFLQKRGILETINAMQWVDRGAIFVLLGCDGDRARGITAKELKAEINRLGLSNRVFIYGPVPAEAMLDYTASADVGVCTLDASCGNHYRSLANKFFCYAAAWLPVAVNNFPEMGGLVRRYHIGVTLDSIDPSEIAEKLNILLQSNGEFKEGIIRFNEVFNWKREGNRLLKIYERLLN